MTRDAEAARIQSILRFAVGTTGAFVASQAAGWSPTFFPPLLAGVLLANLPGSPPLKMGLALIAVQGLSAYLAYILTALLHEIPLVLFGIIAVILLISFFALARGAALMPVLLSLISFSTIPIIAMIAPKQAEVLPLAYTRAMLIAIVAIWLVFAIWPRNPPAKAPAIQAMLEFPFAMAVTGVAIVLPLMLLYLMYGITDALPILITTVVLVINFDPRRSAMQGMVMMLGNFFGGAIALFACELLEIAPSLTMLALITLLIALFFAIRVERGGAAGAIGLVTFNQAIILFGLALESPDSSSGLWLTRLVQFGIACTFAVGMISWLFPMLTSRISHSQPRPA